MKRKFIFFIDILLSKFIYYAYIVPLNIFRLIKRKDLYKHKSYFPEKKQKSVSKIFFEQCLQIIKYGTPNDYYFMYGFDVKSSKEQSEYLHYTPFMRRRDSLNLASNHNSTCILRNKLYFGIFADAFSIKTAKNIAYTINDMIYLLHEKKFITLEEFITLGDYKLFCKLIDGECGNGIFILTINNNKIFYNNEEISSNELHKIIDRKNYLFQEFISQHSEMSRLHKESINSIRLVTVKDINTGKIVALPSILRIGTGNSIVDNTSQGGIAVGFDLDTGRLHEFGFYKPNFGLKINAHPNSNIVFKEFCIPHIKEAIEQAKLFHNLLSDIHSIGWDIAIGQNGPIFIEGNDNWEINGPQIGNHGLKKEFKRFFFHVN